MLMYCYTIEMEHKLNLLIRTNSGLYKNIYMCVYAYVCMYVYGCMYVYIYIYIYLYVCVCSYVCICVYIYTRVLPSCSLIFFLSLAITVLILFSILIFCI